MYSLHIFSLVFSHKKKMFPKFKITKSSQHCCFQLKPFQEKVSIVYVNSSSNLGATKKQKRNRIIEHYLYLLASTSPEFIRKPFSP